MIVKTLQEFYQFFQEGKLILAIDYGSKKIGLALSDPGHSIAMPYKLLDDILEKNKVNQIIKIIHEKNICAITLGMPVNMDGTASDQTIVIEKFANKILGQSNIPIFFQDERLTSKAANNFLKNFNLKRKDRNKIDDLTAASMILETVLNGYRSNFNFNVSL